MTDRCTIPPAGWECSRAPGHDGPCAASQVQSSADGYMTYTRTRAERIWRALGFHGPAAPMLTAGQRAAGWDEQVFAHTDIYVSFGDRLRLLISGRAKLFTIVSTKVKVPAAITNVRFGVVRPGTPLS